MKCDRCDSEATVHEVMIRNGKRHERHLCETCAKNEGMAGQVHIPITQLLNQFITSQIQGSPAAGTGAKAAGAAVPGTCACCGLTINQFKQTGLLGCPDCYVAFEAQLAPLLQRAHEGATQHTGKRPLRFRHVDPGAAVAASVPPVGSPAMVEGPRASGATAAKSVDDAHAALAARMADVLKRLNAAVAAEKYEDAARLRDEFADIKAQVDQGGAGSKASPKAPAKARPNRKTGEEGHA